MKYLKDEVRLLQGIKFKREDIQQAVSNILEGYNKIFNTARHQQNYINKERPKYAERMEQNFKLIERNAFLESEYKRYKVIYKNQVDYIKILEKQLKHYTKKEE